MSQWETLIVSVANINCFTWTHCEQWLVWFTAVNSGQFNCSLFRSSALTPTRWRRGTTPAWRSWCRCRPPGRRSSPSTASPAHSWWWTWCPAPPTLSHCGQSTPWAPVSPVIWGEHQPETPGVAELSLLTPFYFNIFKGFPRLGDAVFLNVFLGLSLRVFQWQGWYHLAGQSCQTHSVEAINVFLYWRGFSAETRLTITDLSSPQECWDRKSYCALTFIGFLREIVHNKELSSNAQIWAFDHNSEGKGWY